MATTRRDFLVQSGAIACLGLLGCTRDGAPTVPGTGLFHNSLSRMRAQNKLGLAIAVPPAPADRCALGHALAALLAEGDAHLREALAESIVVCLPAASIERLVRAGRAGETLVAFDDETGRVDGTSLQPRAWSTSRYFGPIVRRMIHGDDNARLRTRADRIRRSASPALARAIREPESDASYDLLCGGAELLMPLLVHERESAADNVRRSAFDIVIQKHLARVGESQVPVGMAVRESGKQSRCDEQEMCSHEAATSARAFVRFLAH